MHIYTRGMFPCTPVLSQVIYYTYKTKKKTTRLYISGYMSISPGVPHTLSVGFLAPCSRPPGCAGCTSSPTCSVCWCAGDGPAPQRLAEIHCMSSLEYMLCQVECLDIPILQCMHAVFTDRRRRRKGRGHTQ